MRVGKKLVFFSVFFSLFLHAEEKNLQNPLVQNVPTEQIRVLPVDSTPEPESVQLQIVLPKRGEIVLDHPAWIQFRLRGYALGTDSQFPREFEVFNSSRGQTVHFVIDNRPYFPMIGYRIDPFDEEGNYYEAQFKFQIPFTLEPGFHTIRAFPARSFGESLKSEGCYAASFFYVKNKSSATVNLDKPYFTYNGPNNTQRLREKEPVLLDFYLSNCELTKDGYKIRMTIDKVTTRLLTKWIPYYIYGLKKGVHEIRMQLIDKKDMEVPGNFNDVVQTFTIE